MRWLAILALVACGDKLPAPPERAHQDKPPAPAERAQDKPPAPPERSHYDKLDAEQRCEATLPRAARCIDELLVASAEELGNAELTEAVRGDVEKAGTSDPKEVRVLHRSNCVGNRDATQYPDAVMRCWAVEDCTAFAACVMKPEPKTPGTP